MFKMFNVKFNDVFLFLKLVRKLAESFKAN